MEEQVSLRLRLDESYLYWQLSTPFLANWLHNEREQQTFLDVVDAVLMFSDDDEAPDELERLLKLGGSAWRVSGDARSLERRLDDTVTDAAATAAEPCTSAADHLRAAWHAAYGRSPDPGKAYSEAIKAVESAAVPLVLPRDSSATLGKIIRHFEQIAPGHWELAIPNKAGAADISSLVSMLNLLWHGQIDRHGSPGPTRSIPSDAGPAAVHLAATLVQWFVSGAVRKTAR